MKKLNIALLLLLTSVLPSFGTEVPILFRSDVSCALSVDGDSVGNIQAGGVMKASLIVGEHIVSCSGSHPDFGTILCTSTIRVDGGKGQEIVNVACAPIETTFRANVSCALTVDGKAAGTVTKEIGLKLLVSRGSRVIGCKGDLSGVAVTYEETDYFVSNKTETTLILTAKMVDVLQAALNGSISVRTGRKYDVYMKGDSCEMIWGTPPTVHKIPLDTVVQVADTRHKSCLGNSQVMVSYGSNRGWVVSSFLEFLSADGSQQIPIKFTKY